MKRHPGGFLEPVHLADSFTIVGIASATSTGLHSLFFCSVFRHRTWVSEHYAAQLSGYQICTGPLAAFCESPNMTICTRACLLLLLFVDMQHPQCVREVVTNWAQCHANASVNLPLPTGGWRVYQRWWCTLVLRMWSAETRNG